MDSKKYTLTMSDDRIKQYNKEVTVKNTDIATKGAFFVAIIAFITLGSFGWTSLQSILCFFYVLFSAFAAFFAKKHFGEKTKSQAELLCIIMLMLTVPYQWFCSGGFYGVGNLWILFTAIYAMFGTTGKMRHILMTIIIGEGLAVISLTYVFPQLVVAVSERQQRVTCMSSILAIGFYVMYVGIKQRIISDEEAVKIAMMQDDLTAQNQELIAVNDELIDLADQLRTANDTQRHFTASMNHELRAPLNGIEGSLQILSKSENLTEEEASTVRNALISSKAMGQTVNDLLDFAKLEEGKFDIVNRRFDLRDILNNTLQMFLPTAKEKGLALQIRIPRSTRVSIIADGVRIQQIMNNLISNAVKYTQSGSVVMTVRTSSTRLTFKVTDTGQGMTKEEIKVLFDPFTRFNVQENVSIQGTGLGMNIVSSLLKEMNGTIDVSSKVGKGTTFNVSIPIMYHDCSITYSTPREIQVEEEIKDSLSGLRILSVDDMQINRNVLRGMLKKDNVEIEDASSGRKAIDACLCGKYDVILLDHMMPEMDGIAVLDAIHTQGMNKNTPVIMLTGNSGKEYTDLYDEHGAAGYLEKPVMYEKLVAEIVRVRNK